MFAITQNSGPRATGLGMRHAWWTCRAEIEAGVKKLGEEIAKLRELGKKNALIEKELPNVEIFLKSADWAVRYGEIFFFLSSKRNCP